MPATKRPSREVLLTLYTAQGMTDGQIARAFKVDPSTVYRWKKHYGIEISYTQSFQPQVKRGGE